MPFDGREFSGTVIAPPAPTAPSDPSLWERVRSATKSFLPRLKALPALRSFSPDPAVPNEVATVQLLTIARALIADEENWVQGRYETIDGRRCAVGALRVASRLMGVRTPPREATGMLLSVANGRGFNDIEKMNDRSTHAQVLSAFDEAIARAQARYIALG
ncbi:MAG TPA: hypothetical protein VFA03_10185 [Acetobacteraceae bacterium]|nr:hypothetical protein [Acetobacteraceae bacterium]